MDYSHLTLVELRNELQKRDAKISGCKGERIERCVAWYTLMGFWYQFIGILLQQSRMPKSASVETATFIHTPYFHNVSMTFACAQTQE